MYLLAIIILIAGFLLFCRYIRFMCRIIFWPVRMVFRVLFGRW